MNVTHKWRTSWTASQQVPWYDDGQLSRTVLATETSVNRKQVIKPSFQFEHIQKAVESQNLKLLFTQIWLFDYAELD